MAGHERFLAAELGHPPNSRRMTDFMLQSLKRQAGILKDSLTPQIKRLALNFNLVGGHTDYTRFIILGRSRSGSNFLRGLLNSHSQIITFEELFKNPETIGWGLDGYPQDQRTLHRFQTDPVGFLESDVFGKMPLKIRAVGFKAFYYHAYGTSLEPIWSFLKAHNQIRVLHLRRKNILKTHLSKKRAEITDSWINLTGEKEQAPSVTLDFEECRSDFEQTRAWEETYSKFFQQHEVMELVYEDLARNYVERMKAVQAFLGVDPEKVEPQTFKQASRPLSEAITNYSELKHRFAGTPWEEFFTD
jgi:LPS sulfotransferase NodH